MTSNDFHMRFAKNYRQFMFRSEEKKKTEANSLSFIHFFFFLLRKT